MSARISGNPVDVRKEVHPEYKPSVTVARTCYDVILGGRRAQWHARKCCFALWPLHGALSCLQIKMLVPVSQ